MKDQKIYELLKKELPQVGEILKTLPEAVQGEAFKLLIKELIGQGKPEDEIENKKIAPKVIGQVENNTSTSKFPRGG